MDSVKRAMRFARACVGAGSACMASLLIVAGSARADVVQPVAVPLTAGSVVTARELSVSPADGEFLYTGLFSEPLSPALATTVSENQDLARAVQSYRVSMVASGSKDAVQPLLNFLESHPSSAWRTSLQLNLGLIYRQTGHFSKALAIWQQGWDESKDFKSAEGRALANAILAELSQIEAYLGRTEQLRPLLSSVNGRSVGGAPAQLLTASRVGLYEMTYRPGESFRCGPLALLRILRFIEKNPSPAALKVLQEDSPSTDHGLSLTMVEEISKRAGMHYQMAYRSAGAPLVLPAVAHWRAGHYAAIVDQDSNGKFIVQDLTFGEDIRPSAQTLDEESSGYFLIPEGNLPKGWRAVTTKEGDTVWGRGNAGANHAPGGSGSGAGGGGTGPCGGSGGGSGGGTQPPPPCTTATVELSIVGLQLNDTPVGYKPPIGPEVRFHLEYSHRDDQQPATFSYINFGPKWTFNWLSYVTDTVNSSASATVYLRGGGSEPITFASTSSTTAYPGPYFQTTLTRTVNGSGNSTSFTATHPDGSFEVYGLANGNQFFMTEVGDSAGNVVTLTYDASYRITQITDAIGEVSTLSYGVSGNPLLVTQITDPFGRSASLTYNAGGELSSITDILGITSSYLYGQGSDPDFINTLTTPYGTTTFTYGDLTTNPALGDTRFVKITDPLGRTSYVEFDEGVDAGDTSGGTMINANLIPTGMNTCNEYLNYRNTFIFDPNQYQLATAAGGGLNYAYAHVIHWLHTDDGTDASRVRESEKQPLENRVWYNYPGQSSSLCQSIFFGVSSGGTVLNGASNRPSAVGRVVENNVTQLMTYQYNPQGNVTQTTDPAGRQWTFGYPANGIDLISISNTTNSAQTLESRTYNNQHLPVTVTRASGATDHFYYNNAGKLVRFTDALGHTTTYTYDGRSRLKEVQGALASNTYLYTYDNVSRVSSSTDPAGATVRYTYDVADRQVTSSYPDGTVSKRAYTLLDLTKSTDRTDHVTQLKYDSDRELVSVTDPAGNATKYSYNPNGALTAIIDPDGHATAFVLDAESRVTTKQFANGTSQSFTYESSHSLVAEVTDALSQITTASYNSDDTIATISYSANQPTPSVSFAYDPSYARIASMTDGIGRTNYTYYPVSNGTLGAGLLQSVVAPIAGESGVDAVVYYYDSLNRLEGSNVDGEEQSVQYDAIGRVSEAFNALDTFTYGYSDGTNRIASVTSTSGPSATLSYFGPSGDELLEQLTYKTQSGSTTLNQFGYTYNSDDLVKTYTNSSPSSQSTTYSYDTANRLTSAVVGSGIYTYAYDKASNLLSIDPNSTAANFAYNSVNEITSGIYDANGSPLSLGGNTYKWDGANRIVHFANATANTGSAFTYDGLGRLVRVVDTKNGAITADHSYFWCGALRCLSHNNLSSSSPATQYFNQGVIAAGTPYYYIKDRLGSIDELITSSGMVSSQFTYDPYGNQTISTGNESDFGYAGYFYHSASGLNFAVSRAYDSAHARWLNRDPIAEAGGINLYAYVGGNPATNIDPSGHLLAPPVTMNPLVAGAAVSWVIGTSIGTWIYNSNATAIQDELDKLLNPPSVVLPTDGSDPPSAQNLVPVNPGKDCNGNCKPCPPDQTWSHPSDAHGSTGGIHYHGIVWNQNPTTCMCFPNRVSGPDPDSMR